MINVPYTFNGEVDYQPYTEVEYRIRKFEAYTKIGKDSSGNYDMFLVEIGNPSKPTIFVMASLHGSEWQSTQYSLALMEQLRDNTFPNKKLRNKLLNEYHIAYLPVANPYGYNRTNPFAITKGRRNSNKVDLNRDFVNFSQEETKNIEKVLTELKPFAFLDCHLIRSNPEREELLMVGNGNTETDEEKEMFIKAWEAYTGRKVENWSAGDEGKEKVSRTYMGHQPNNHTPATLSIVTEMTRPVKKKTGVETPLTNKELFEYGMASIYIFLELSKRYFEKNNTNKKYRLGRKILYKARELIKQI